jgi:hypothetical protein
VRGAIGLEDKGSKEASPLDLLSTQFSFWSPINFEAWSASGATDLESRIFYLKRQWQQAICELLLMQAHSISSRRDSCFFLYTPYVAIISADGRFGPLVNTIRCSSATDDTNMARS